MSLHLRTKLKSNRCLDLGTEEVLYYENIFFLRS